MDIQKALNEHDEAVERKIKVDEVIKNIKEKDELDFCALPSELRDDLRRYCLKQLSEESRFVDNQIEEASIWLDTCIEKTREEMEQMSYDR